MYQGEISTNQTAESADQTTLVLTILTNFRHLFICLFSGGRIIKRSNRRYALENLESSGTKIMMSGPIVWQLCERRNRNKPILKMNFFFSSLGGFVLPVTTLVRDSRHAWNFFRS